MIVFIILICILAEYRFSPRLDYLKEDSVLMFFYSAKKGERKSIIIKL
jgi:hypothetical protein